MDRNAWWRDLGRHPADYERSSPKRFRPSASTITFTSAGPAVDDVAAQHGARRAGGRGERMSKSKTAA